MCPHYIYVRILLYVCVLTIYVCPHTTVYVCPHYMCVRILLYICVLTIYVCVLILLYICVAMCVGDSCTSIY